MGAPETLKKVRRRFLGTCQDLVKEFKEVEAAQSFGSDVGDSYTRHYRAGESTTDTSATTAAPPEPATWTSGPIQRIRVALHAVLIQEWHTYLNDVYERVIWDCLVSKKELTDLHPIKVNLVRLEPQDASSLRRSICREARSAFSDKGYQVRIPMLNKVFGVASGHITWPAQSTTGEHVKIRNIFQHSRGVLKNRHTKNLGLAPGTPLYLTDETGTPQGYSIGKTINLSKFDIEKLRAGMKTHSEAYEVLP